MRRAPGDLLSIATGWGSGLSAPFQIHLYPRSLHFKHAFSWLDLRLDHTVLPDVFLSNWRQYIFGRLMLIHSKGRSNNGQNWREELVLSNSVHLFFSSVSFYRILIKSAAVNSTSFSIYGYKYAGVGFCWQGLVPNEPLFGWQQKSSPNLDRINCEYLWGSWVAPVNQFGLHAIVVVHNPRVHRLTVASIEVS